MSEVRLAADVRTEFGKGGARRLRRAGKIPAVIYGHGEQPRHIALPEREFMAAVRHNGVNVLVTLSLGGTDQLVIPKAIQRHPIKNMYEHVDLLAVRRGEKVTVDVPVIVVGDAVADAVVAQDAASISIEAEATHLPSQIEVDVAGLVAGTQITAGELRLPEGVTLASDADTLVVAIAHAQTAELPEEEAAAAPEPVPAGEGAGESAAPESAGA